MEDTIKKATLTAVLAVALCATFAVPADDSPTWMGDLIASKLVAAIGWLCVVLMNNTWKLYGREE